MRSAVVVLGDLGRSPRMQYHALALVAHGDVDLVGLEGAPLHAAVSAEPRVHVHVLRDRSFSTRASKGRTWFVGLSALRAALQAARLFARLVRLPAPDLILVQNPPAVPSLAVAWLAARLRGARLVIDWHNLSHTVLAVRLGEGHRAVRALARSERRWGRRADAHLAVSQALATWLRVQWQIEAQVVRDRPVAYMARPSAAAAEALWRRLAGDLGLDAAVRPPLVVCPTSWTPDEDLDLLLEAAERADRASRRRWPEAAGPRLVVLMTGRGELRPAFERRLARRDFTHVAVRTVWLDPPDYPVLVGMADAGLCLHQSSSGLDLPMKVADFRGAGVPVLAYDYAPVLGEVLTPGREGVIFHEPGELAALLAAVAAGDPAADPTLAAARAWLAANGGERWEDVWPLAAAPALVAR